MSNKIIVSSCLIGKRCAYDGKIRENSLVKKLCADFGCIDICPEMAGGLTSPREANEIDSGSGEDVIDGKARVVSLSGKCNTERFVKGARIALKCALLAGVSIAVLKQKSPSCGKGQIYSGKFNGVLRNGNGVTAALLLRRGIRVFTETEVDKDY